MGRMFPDSTCNGCGLTLEQQCTEVSSRLTLSKREPSSVLVYITSIFSSALRSEASITSFIQSCITVSSILPLVTQRSPFSGLIRFHLEPDVIGLCLHFINQLQVQPFEEHGQRYTWLSQSQPLMCHLQLQQV